MIEIDTSPRAQRIIDAMDRMDSTDLQDRAFVAYVKAHEAWLDSKDDVLHGVDLGCTYVGGGYWRRPDGTLVLNPWDVYDL